MNLFKRFRDLLPETDRRQIGTVAAVDTGANTTTLTTLGGGSVTVSGTGVAVGQTAFFTGGQLDGAAPELPSYEIEV